MILAHFWPNGVPQLDDSIDGKMLEARAAHGRDLADTSPVQRLFLAAMII